jgi:arabinofuranan 3-O-arabinosyltransferase
VTRTLQPLGGIGSTRVLDDIERRIMQRRPSPGLRETLRRAGIRYVVARNDLAWRRTSAPRPMLVRDALRNAGLVRVARFGPRVPKLASSADLLPDLGIGEEEHKLRMIEIYAVDPKVEPVTTAAVRRTTIVSGGPESIAQLADAGRAGSATVLAGDLPDGAVRGGRWVVSDALRRVRTDFGLVRDNTSYTLAAGELAAGSTATPQFLAPNLIGHETVALPPGVGGAVSASSYGSWLLQLPELQPGNAFDRNADTVWVAGSERTSAGEWVEAMLPAARPVTGMKVRLLREGAFRPRITRITVITDSGVRSTRLADTEALQPLRVAPGPTRQVRVVLAAVTGERRGAIGAGLRDIYLPNDVGLRRFVAPAQEPALRARARSADQNPTYLLSRLVADPFDLLRRDEETQLRRRFVVPVDGEFRAGLVVTPIPSTRLDALLTRTRGLQVRGTSSYGAQPRYKPANAFDGTRTTSWIAAPAATQPLRTPSAPGLAAVNRGTVQSHASPVPSVVDDHPALRVRIANGARTISRVRVLAARGFAVAPRMLRVTNERGESRLIPVRLGRFTRFRSLRAQTLTITFPQVRPRYTNGPSGRQIPLPVGVSEIDFPALRDQRVIPLPPALPVATRCGDGPPMLVDGARVQTRVSTTAGDAVSLAPAHATICGATTLRLPAGLHGIRGAGSGPFVLSELRLSPAQPAGLPWRTRRRATIVHWETTHRTVQVTAGVSTYLAIAHNFNRGWQATLDGTPLATQQIDGWKQGFVIPAGRAGTVEILYAPDAGFRRILLIGLVLALSLFVLLALPLRGMGAVQPPAPPVALPSGVWRWPFFWVGGFAVAAISWPVVPVLVGLAWIRRGPGGKRRLAAIAAGSLFGAALIAATAESPFAGDHGGAFSAPAQLLAATAFAALVLSVIWEEGRYD